MGELARRIPIVEHVRKQLSEIAQLRCYHAGSCRDAQRAVSLRRRARMVFSQSSELARRIPNVPHR